MKHTGRISLVGVGPGPFSLLTGQAIETILNSNVVFMDGYTSVYLQSENDDFFKWAEEKNIQIKIASRPLLEQPENWMKEYRNQQICVIVLGDPMLSTTHSSLVLLAEEFGYFVNIIHGLGVNTLIGSIGLQSTKFGRIVSIVYPYRDIILTSPLEHLAFNYWQGLHTLVLLDLDPTGEGVDKPIPMTPLIARDSLIKMNQKLTLNDIDSPISLANNASVTNWLEISIDERDVILCSDLGSSDEKIYFCKLKHLQNISLGTIHCLIFPSNLTQIEKQMISRLDKFP